MIGKKNKEAGNEIRIIHNVLETIRLINEAKISKAMGKNESFIEMRYGDLIRRRVKEAVNTYNKLSEIEVKKFSYDYPATDGLLKLPAELWKNKEETFQEVILEAEKTGVPYEEVEREILAAVLKGDINSAAETWNKKMTSEGREDFTKKYPVIGYMLQLPADAREKEYAKLNKAILKLVYTLPPTLINSRL